MRLLLLEYAPLLGMIGIYASSVHWWPPLFDTSLLSDGVHVLRQFSVVTLADAVLLLLGYGFWLRLPATRAHLVLVP